VLDGSSSTVAPAATKEADLAFAVLTRPKSRNLGVSATGEEDIGRLDLPMTDPLLVRGVQHVCELNLQTQHLVDWQRVAVDDASPPGPPAVP
jgi:hypothetical protein